MSIKDIISFCELKSLLNIYNAKLFNYCIKDKFEEISTQKNRIKILEKQSFYKFLNLPIFMSERLYDQLIDLEKGNLTEDSFSTFMNILYLGSFHQLANLIFNIYDYDQDGLITLEKIKHLLKLILISLKRDEETKENSSEEYQLKIISEIESYLSSDLTTITLGRTINFESFLLLIREKSDVFLQPLCFLYLNIPISQNDIWFYRHLLDEDSSQEEHFIAETANDLFCNTRELYPVLKISAFQTLYSKLRTKNTEKRFKLLKEKIEIINKITLNKKAKENKHSKKGKKGAKKNPKNPNLIYNVDNYDGDDDCLINIEMLKDEDYNVEEDFRGDDHYDVDNCFDQERSDRDLLCYGVIKKFTQVKFSKEVCDKDMLNFHEVHMNSYFTYTDFSSDLVSSTTLSFKLNKSCTDIKNENNNYDKTFDKVKINHVNFNTKLEFLYDEQMKRINSKYFDLQKSEDQEKIRKIDLLRAFLKWKNVGNSIENLLKKNITKSNVNFYEKYKDKSYFNEKFVDDIIYYSIYHYITNESSKDINNDYDLFDENVLGKGSFSTVIKGIKKNTKEEVAIKKISKTETKFNYFEVKNEVDILSLIKHTNIVSFIDFYENKDFYFIVTDYIKDLSLELFLKSIKDNVLSEEVASRISYQLASALHYLNKMGIIHSDLKLSNIMLSLIPKSPKSKDSTDSTVSTQSSDSAEKDDKSNIITTNPKNIVVKIIDFGLSRLYSSKLFHSKLCGTQFYFAPEVTIKNNISDFPVDIWSFGLILFKMTTGVWPSISSIEDNFKNVIEFNSKSNELKDLLMKCLTIKKEKRIKIKAILSHKWFSKF